MKLLKYFLIFNAVYYAAQFAMVAVGALLTIDIPSGASMGAVVAGAILAGRAFVLDHRRLPSSAEKWRLVFGSLAVSLGLSVLLSALFFAFVPDAADLVTSMISQLGIAGFAAILVVVILVHLAAMYFGFGFLLTRIMKDYDAEPRQEPRQEPRL